MSKRRRESLALPPPTPSSPLSPPPPPTKSSCKGGRAALGESCKERVRVKVLPSQDYNGDLSIGRATLRVRHSTRMRLTVRHETLGLLALLVVGLATAAPIPSQQSAGDATLNSIEAYEDGLMVLVPTIPAADKEKSGHDLKREVEYEIIAIPGELLRREIRQISQSYLPPSGGSNIGVSHDNSQLFTTDTVQDFGEVIIPKPPSTSTQLNFNFPTTSVSAAPDFSSVISSVANVAGQTSQNIGNAGQTLAQVGSAGTQVLGQIGSAAASGGIQLAGWLANQKANGLSTATKVVGNGLQYAGQLSAGVLRALLQVPAIKARVLSEVIEAGQPLIYAVSDVLSESSDDLATFFEAKTSIVQEALGIIIRLIQDTLALKGRIIYSLSSSGLDIGATAFNAGVKIGGAAVESATGIAAALGSGFSDLIATGKTVRLPAPPALPPITLPSLPAISIPSISIPNIDLSGLIPSKPTISALPAPSKPTFSVSTGTPSISVSQPAISVGVSTQDTYTPPSQSYGVPLG
ncbi:uncharacterized protein [Palaemon carinicauda]|uniref:uncharacterized protein n=1 Tax=Palaemon carinicauda TaxID=392227 RepID=UPI0035B5B575